MTAVASSNLVLFDGLCGTCNATVGGFGIPGTWNELTCRMGHKTNFFLNYLPPSIDTVYHRRRRELGLTIREMMSLTGMGAARFSSIEMGRAVPTESEIATLNRVLRM